MRVIFFERYSVNHTGSVNLSKNKKFLVVRTTFICTWYTHTQVLVPRCTL